MKRRLVKQGAATLMISLPSKWLKKFNLNKGDEVDIEEQENDLILSKDYKSEKKQTKINIIGYTESSVRTSIVNAYRLGYDKIEISYKEENYKAILKTIKDYIIGFDITKNEKNVCIIENITEPSEEQFDTIFRKILYNISALIKNTKERLKENTQFEEYKDTVLKIHQYDNFCRRVISKKNLFGNQSNLFWAFLTLLIHAQRELYHLNKFLDKNKVKFTSIQFFEKLEKMFNLLEEGYIKKDVEKLEKIHEIEKSVIYNEFYSLIQKNQKENIILYHTATSMKNIYLASSPLIGLFLR